MAVMWVKLWPEELIEVILVVRTVGAKVFTWCTAPGVWR